MVIDTIKEMVAVYNDGGTQNATALYLSEDVWDQVCVEMIGSVQTFLAPLSERSLFGMPVWIVTDGEWTIGIGR